MKNTITVLVAAALFCVSLAASAGSERLGPTQPKPTGTNAVAETCSNLVVQDCGFEAGPFGGVWTESSTNFGTPICDVASCGTGTTPNGYYDGAFWAWFGGTSSFEEGSVSQSFVIPSSTSATLTFWFLAGVCSGDAGDFIEVTLDGAQLWTATGGLPRDLCGNDLAVA